MENEEKEQEHIKTREDQKRGSPHFQPGDKVLMHWPSFRPYADLFRKHRLRYVGPFTVIRMVGTNAVELEGLPEHMPNVINAEYLHPYITDDHPLLRSLRLSPDPPLPQREIRMLTAASPSLGGAVVLEPSEVVLEPSEVDETERRKVAKLRRQRWEKMISQIYHPNPLTQVRLQETILRIFIQYATEHHPRRPVCDDVYLYSRKDDD